MDAAGRQSLTYGARMSRPSSPLIESLARNWQMLLIASLPGSLLRLWAFASGDRADALITSGALPDPSMMGWLLHWSGEHVLTTLLMFPLMAIGAALAYDFYGPVARAVVPT